MVDDLFLEARHADPESIAVMFQVPLHMCTYDLPPGYWSRELARTISRRSLRSRVRRLRYRITDWIAR